MKRYAMFISDSAYEERFIGFTSQTSEKKAEEIAFESVNCWCEDGFDDGEEDFDFECHCYAYVQEVAADAVAYDESTESFLNQRQVDERRRDELIANIEGLEIANQRILQEIEKLAASTGQNLRMIEDENATLAQLLSDMDRRSVRID